MNTPTPDRLRFTAFTFERLPNGRCRAEVRYEWEPGRTFQGQADGLASEAGELRCAAQAALIALEAAVDRRITFDLLGVKAVRAFDSIVVLVSVSAHMEGASHRLVGSFLTEEQTPRSAALAVLHATNRVLGNLFVRNGNT
jgi:hypothetical protein